MILPEFTARISHKYRVGYFFSTARTCMRVNRRTSAAKSRRVPEGVICFGRKNRFSFPSKPQNYLRILFPAKPFLPVTRRSFTSWPIPVVFKILAPRRFQIHHSRTHRRR